LSFKVLVHHFFASLSPVYCKELDSIRTKLTEETDFEVRPYGDSGNGTAAAAHSVGYSDWTGGVQRSKLGGIPNWGRNRAVKTNWLACVCRVRATTLFSSHFIKNKLDQCVQHRLHIHFQSISTHHYYHYYVHFLFNRPSFVEFSTGSARYPWGNCDGFIQAEYPSCCPTVSSSDKNTNHW